MQYISVEEYLAGKCQLTDLPDEYIANVNTLIPRVNELLEAFGQYRKCNSGYRTQADQMRINPAAMKSNHLKCAAIDLEDHDGALDAWCLQNLAVLEKLGLWLESPASTINWCHLQCLQPKSGHRVFIP